MFKKFHFSVINLWCSKNLVDIEFMIWNIFNYADKIDIEFSLNPDDENIEYVIINTCWFLSSSRKEAEEVIKEFDDKWKKVILMWCYAEVKDNDFILSLKNLHAIIPHWDSKDINLIFENKEFSETLKDKIDKTKLEKVKNYLKWIWWDNLSKKAFIWNSSDQRAYINADFGHEFLKISEWCDNNCSFCIIPSIRWRQKSRNIEDIITEVKIMLQNWIKEIQIISQDTTRYGTDFWDSNPKLIDLLEEIDKVEWDFKYKVYYMYPDILTFNHLDRMSKLKKMLPYFDMPFQHISPKILKRMWRFYDEKHIYKILDYIKELFPNVFLHTNFIVWFPWEEESDFELLKDFAKKYEFDSVSMFGYHDEPLASSSKLDQKISDEIIEKRVYELREILDEIYDKKDIKRVWKKEVWYIMNIWNNKCEVRPEIKAPEVDEYDIVKFEDILSKDFDLWSKVEYILK